jgi:hypothetical protein
LIYIKINQLLVSTGTTRTILYQSSADNEKNQKIFKELLGIIGNNQEYLNGSWFCQVCKKG